LHYPAMMLVHAGWLAGLWVFAYDSPRHSRLCRRLSGVAGRPLLGARRRCSGREFGFGVRPGRTRRRWGPNHALLKRSMSSNAKAPARGGRFHQFC
jgi:hypothetical protein